VSLGWRPCARGKLHGSQGYLCTLLFCPHSMHAISTHASAYVTKSRAARLPAHLAYLSLSSNLHQVLLLALVSAGDARALRPAHATGLSPARATARFGVSPQPRTSPLSCGQRAS
jgi:hypothetical protein